MRPIYLLLVSLLITVPGFSQGQSFTVATLNCYWFFNGEEGKSDNDKPRSKIEYSTKARHIIGLLPREAPLFIGFQEIGGGEDLAALAKSASARYGRQYQTLFAHGKDTSTGQNVGAILDIAGKHVAASHRLADDVTVEPSLYFDNFHAQTFESIGERLLC